MLTFALEERRSFHRFSIRLEGIDWKLPSRRLVANRENKSRRKTLPFCHRENCEFISFKSLCELPRRATSFVSTTPPRWRKLATPLVELWRKNSNYEFYLIGTFSLYRPRNSSREHKSCIWKRFPRFAWSRRKPNAANQIFTRRDAEAFHLGFVWNSSKAPQILDVSSSSCVNREARPAN